MDRYYEKNVTVAACGQMYRGECVDTHYDGRLWVMVDGVVHLFYRDEVLKVA